jgi:CheY-like chemotaxis protein/anti-sigma regulatory factor (Ser/Thr protein kinase)
VPKILIVDDASTDRARVAGIASRWLDCCILEADNGKSALDQIEMHLPDLVLTDLHMPEMDGLELVSAVRDDYPHIPVILMTGQGSEEIAAKALRRGAASYVPKLQLAENLIDTLTQVHKTAQVAQAQSQLMHYMTDTATSFTLPNDRKFISICINQILNMLRCLPLGDETERLRIGIALQEAFDNAYFHGNLEVHPHAANGSPDPIQVALERENSEPWMHRRIHVYVAIDRRRAEITVRDDGDGFDVAAAGSSPSEDGTQGGGRGITLMRSIMDEVAYNEAGNEVTMIRYAVQGDDED